MDLFMTLVADRVAADNVLRKVDALVDWGRVGRVFNAFKRPLGTSSSQNTVWHGYQPTTPPWWASYLTVFRTAANFISVGTDGRTPALRLGLAKQPLTYEDILWLGETAPRPRRSRRKGRQLAGLRRTRRIAGDRRRTG